MRANTRQTHTHTSVQTERDAEHIHENMLIFKRSKATQRPPRLQTLTPSSTGQNIPTTQMEPADSEEIQRFQDKKTRKILQILQESFIPP